MALKNLCIAILPPEKSCVVFGPASLMLASGAELSTATSKKPFPVLVVFREGLFSFAADPGRAAWLGGKAGAATRTGQRPRGERRQRTHSRKGKPRPDGPPQKPPPQRATDSAGPGRGTTRTDSGPDREKEPATEGQTHQRTGKQQQT